MAKIGRMVKERMVQQVDLVLGESPSFFVTSLERLSATEADTLRRKLKGMKAEVHMVKRRLGIRSVSAKKLDQTKTLFEGSIALVVPGEDLVPAAKLLFDFAKSSEDRLSIRGAWVEGQLLDVKKTKELADLPSRNQLIANLIGVIESPISELVMVIESLLGEVPWIAEEASKTRPAAKQDAPQEVASADSVKDASAPQGQETEKKETEQQEGSQNG